MRASRLGPGSVPAALLLARLLLVHLFPAAPALGAAATGDTLRIAELLVIEPAAEPRRTPVPVDLIELVRVRGTWSTPRPGAEVAFPDGTRNAWRRLVAGADGWFADSALAGGTAVATVDLPQAGVYLLAARGHRSAIVNGEPRGGDPYELGLSRFPVNLRAGENELVFRAGRGRITAALLAPPASVFIEPGDATLPDLLAGESDTLWAGILVTNATAAWQEGWTLAAVAGEGPSAVTALPPLAPLTARKAAVAIVPPPRVTPGTDAKLALVLKLRDAAGRPAHAATLALGVRRPSARHRRTFRSAIDGSVQYFAVTPRRDRAARTPPALVLTLHGAGVEAVNQAAAYAPKDWAVIVAPTNRRPFGFDWEDWGRRDALEVLACATALFRPDPERIHLTGHSMGGHGTWQLGAHFAHRFAAIAPSAGWIDFWSYAGAAEWPAPTAVESLLVRAANPSRTLLLERNLAATGVYVLHGAADDNVPVSEARAMRARLGTFHPDWAYHEEPGAGHWWGDACVDWPPLFAFLAGRRLPAERTRLHVDFTTVNPAISAQAGWVTIAAQERPLCPSRVEATIEPARRALTLATENVRRLALDLEPFVAAAGDTATAAGDTSAALAPGAPLVLAIDGGGPAAVEWPERGSVLYLARDRAGDLRPGPPPPAALKGPHRAGPFKEAFANRMLFVYGTQGTAAENEWAYSRARFDAETFLVRGNGAVDILPDSRFDAAAARDRNVILYGNATTNAVWPAVLPANCPLTVSREAVVVGERRLAGEDLACLFIYPRLGSDVAAVGVIAGTGLPGLRLTDQLPVFTSGVAYPDWIVLGVEMLERGSGGVRGAGFFGDDWSLARGESAWRDAPAPDGSP